MTSMEILLEFQEFSLLMKAMLRVSLVKPTMGYWCGRSFKREHFLELFRLLSILKSHQMTHLKYHGQLSELLQRYL